MLKCSTILASQSAAALGSRYALGQRSSTFAVPTLFEPAAAPVSFKRSVLVHNVQSLWNRCVSVVRPALNTGLASGSAKESQILYAAEGRPTLHSPGFVVSSRTKVANFLRGLYRNIYTDFPSSQKKCIWWLVGANVTSFFLWQTYGNGPTGRQAMWENFMISIKTVRCGRLWVFLTSPVSSNDLITLSLNTTALLSFGVPVLAAIGAMPFLGFYFGSAFLGSLVHMEYFAFPIQTQTPTQNQLWYSDHASYHASTAAASALAGFYAGAWSNKPVYLFNSIRTPSIILSAAFFAFQLAHAENTRQPWQGSLSTLALGLAFGFLSRGRVRI